MSSFEPERSVFGGTILFRRQYLVIPDQQPLGLMIPYLDRMIGEFCSSLGLRVSDVFPLRYQLRVPLEGEQVPRQGVFHIPPDPALNRARRKRRAG